MQFNHNVIKQIINDLNKSIVLHTDQKENIYSDCHCGSKEVIGKCYHCQLEEAIGDLDCLKSSLIPISKNTIHHLQFIDVESFCYSLGKTAHINSIVINPVWDDPDSELDPEHKPINLTIDVTPESRFAMDGNGFHVGYESVTYRFIAYSKRQLGIAGIPYLLSSWVVNPNEYEIIDRDLPPNDEPDPEYDHDDNCSFKGQGFDDCDCLEFYEGYYQPDDDFFYQEMQSILDSTNWIEAEFNPDTREWTLGYTSFNVEEYQSNPDYANACDQDNGMPSFGDYC